MKPFLRSFFRKAWEFVRWLVTHVRIPRRPFHGFVLAGVDIGSVVVAYGVYRLLRPVPQIPVQVTAAAILVVSSFLLWNLVVGLVRRHWALTQPGDVRAVWLWSLLAGPVLFVPLHFLIRGYVTSLGNLKGLILFQVPVNLMAVFFAYRFSIRVDWASKPDK